MVLTKELAKLGGVFHASLISFIAILAFGIYDFVTPLFIDELSKNYAIVGSIISFAYVASLLAEVPIGISVDKFGRIRVLALATFSLGVIGILYFLTKNVYQLAVLAFLYGVVSVAFWVPSTVLVRDYSPRKLLSQAQGIYLSTTQVGWVLGPVLGGIIIDSFTVKHSFLLFAALMFLTAFLSIVTFRGKKAKKFRKVELKVKHIARLNILYSSFRKYIRLHKFALPLYLLSLFAYIWISIQWAFIALASEQKFGFTEYYAGLILGAMMVIQGILFFASGYLMDKVGKKYILTAGYFLLFASMYFAFLSVRPEHYVFFLLLAGASLSWILPGTEALLTEIAPANILGEMSSVFDTSKDLGLIIGPLIGGLLAQSFSNPMFPFLFVAIVAAAGCLLCGYVFWPRQKR